MTPLPRVCLDPHLKCVGLAFGEALGDRAGPLEKAHRGYRTASGDNARVTVRVHPDERVQLVLELWREADGILPLDAPMLLKRCPSVGSAATARRAASDIKLLTPLIYYLIRDMSDSSVSYRKVGQKKRFTALIDTSLDDQSLISTLSDLAGRAIEIVKD